MKQTVRLTESELRRMIDESVEMVINEAMQDEGFFGNIGRGLKSAFGGDAQKIGQAAGRMGKSIKQGATNAAKAVQKGAQNVAQGAVNKYNDMKVGYQSGQQNDQLNNIKSTLQQMLNNGRLGNGSVAKSAQSFIKTLDQAIRNNNNAARNPRGIQANRFNEE